MAVKKAKRRRMLHRLPARQYSSYEAAYRAAVRHNTDAPDLGGYRVIAAVLEGPGDGEWTVMDLRDAIDAEMPYDVPGRLRGRRADRGGQVSGPRKAGRSNRAAGNSVWPWVVGIAAVGGTVWLLASMAAAQTIAGRSLDVMQQMATRRPGGVGGARPLPPPPSILPMPPAGRVGGQMLPATVGGVTSGCRGGCPSSW